MKQHYVMPVGVDNFRQVREEYYYVDKTDFIKSLIDGHSKVTLITRPRRFGKTLAMSMLYYFFTMEDAEANRSLFSGCKIEAAGKKYMKHQGSKPVIFLSLKDIKQMDFPSMIKSLAYVMQNAYRSHAYLYDSELLDKFEKEYFNSVMSRNMDAVDLQLSLQKLSSWLHRYHQKTALILIDEYDAPIQTARDYGYYDEAIVFMRNYLSTALKSNPHLDFAIITGVLRIAKESIFSALNNLKVSSVAGGGLETVVGFDETEIEKIAYEFGVPEKLAEIKEWYDGYNFSGHEIYNPWSVISYFENSCRPAAYWVNTSENSILHHLLKHATPSQTQDLTKLLNGGKIQTSLHESVVYEDIQTNSRSLNSVLLTTGYLTMADYPDPETGDSFCTMRIPNKEIRTLFKREVLSHLEDMGSSIELLTGFAQHLLSGHTSAFAEDLENFMQLMTSYYDTANRESFYHGLMLGLLTILIPRYEVISNRESGYGRFDAALLPKNTDQPGAIMEFKVAEKEADLPKMAEAALAQIENMDYMAEFRNKNITQVWQYGIAFYGKKCQIATKT